MKIHMSTQNNELNEMIEEITNNPFLSEDSDLELQELLKENYEDLTEEQKTLLYNLNGKLG